MLHRSLRWLAAVTGAITLIYALSLSPHAPPLRDDTNGKLAGGVTTLGPVMLNSTQQ